MWLQLTERGSVLAVKLERWAGPWPLRDSWVTGRALGVFLGKMGKKSGREANRYRKPRGEAGSSEAAMLLSRKEAMVAQTGRWPWSG